MKRLILCSMLLVAGCGARPAKLAANPDAARPAALAENTTLGRVVVYRNGVAYFERHAHVTGDALVLSVPADKIDDLLKSLTVTDVRTKQPAPVAYRTDVQPGKDSVVEMTIGLSGPAPHDLLLSYVAEAPAWKPSYRVVMGQDGEIDLQGWTVIDNASGEDWSGVRVGVGSSAALSFRHDLRSIRDVPRDTMRTNAPFALTDRAEDPSGPPAAPTPAASPPRPPTVSSTEAIGSAQFESPLPMTVRRGTSAMISILHERTQGEIAYLYDPKSTSPDAQFPYRVVRLKNPTSSVLESGPFALFGDGRFIGEGLPDPIPANGVAFISFALDRQVVVAPGPAGSHESIAKIHALENGVAQTEMRHAVKRTYVIKNRQSERAVVYVRHLVSSGFHLTTPSSEKLGDAQLFRVTVEPNAQTELAIEEEAPIARTIDVRAPGALELVLAFLDAGPPDNPLRARVAALAAIDKSLRDDGLREAMLRREVAAYAERAAELKAQVAELRAARTGAPLQKELAKLLVDVERSQSKATAESAALKDTLTVARIAFQNRAADLSMAASEKPLPAQVPELVVNGTDRLSEPDRVARHR
jgi:hypothetical protein